MPAKLNRLACLFLSACILVVTSGCSARAATLDAASTSVTTASAPAGTPTLASSATDTRLPDPTATQLPTATPAPVSIWLSPNLPAGIAGKVELAAGIVPAALADQATYRLEVSDDHPVGKWVYALVAPFPTVNDGVSLAELQAAWHGQNNGPFEGKPLFMDENTRQVFTALWGAPAAQAVTTLPSAVLDEYAWRYQPSWGIVPFDTLTPRYKVLEVDGMSPIRKEFAPAQYPLAVPISLNPGTDPARKSPATEALFAALPATNRDSNKMTVIVMTGVTALVRATAELMARKGVLYPATDVREILLDADITHISNEVPFARDCPKPDPWQEGLKFCSNPKYMALLKDIDADVIELTGDHFGDYGREAMTYTLDLYHENNLPYYGGGYNEEEGQKPLLIEHNGNQLAFIGCNGKGGGYATARGPFPGAIDCKGDWMQKEIARLKADGDIPIVTSQHFEYYTYDPMPLLIKDFRSWAEAGAAIVSGSQAHQPHGFEYYAGAFIHYGLGNLFFDQLMMEVPTTKAFIDRHVIYDGRHISTELLVIKAIDQARPRPATPEERQDLLQTIFQHSLW
jgi:poly-gamma-glutamate synthesis protein (capsule biosynthesis protein)